MNLNINPKDNLRAFKGILRFLLGLSWLLISMVIVALIIVLFREPSWQPVKWVFLLLVGGFVTFYWIHVGLNRKNEKPHSTRESVAKFFRENWFKISILILSIFTIVFSSWWFAIKPTIIKSQCAWTKRHIDAVPAQSASPNWPECLSKPSGSMFESLENLFDCHAATPAQPEKDYYSESSNAEYAFCLREHGL